MCGDCLANGPTTIILDCHDQEPDQAAAGPRPHHTLHGATATSPTAAASAPTAPTAGAASSADPQPGVRPRRLQRRLSTPPPAAASASPGV